MNMLNYITHKFLKFFKGGKDYMYMSIAESEAEVERAYEAFYGAYKSNLLKIEYEWQNAFNASRECKISLKSLNRTASYMKNNFKKTFDDNVNKFLYVYFRNKPETLNDEVIEICKIAVKTRIYTEIDRIFD